MLASSGLLDNRTGQHQGSDFPKVTQQLSARVRIQTGPPVTATPRSVYEMTSGDPLFRTPRHYPRGGYCSLCEAGKLRLRASMNLKGVRVLVAYNTLGNLAGKEFIQGYCGIHRPRGGSGQVTSQDLPFTATGPRHCSSVILGLSVLPPC